MGIRSAPNHFASNQTQMIIVSAPLDDNTSQQQQQLMFEWTHELTIEMEADMREPYFLRFISVGWWWLVIVINII